MDTTLPAILHESSLLPVEFLSGELVTRCMNEIAVFQSADELVQKAHSERLGKRYLQSLELYEKALTVDPCHELGLFWAGYCLLPDREWEPVVAELYGTRWRLAVNQSIGYYLKLINLKEQDKDKTLTTMSSCYVNLGVGHDFLNEKSSAEECWQKAIDLDGDAVAYANLGWLRKRMDRVDDAIDLCNKAITKDKTYASSYFCLGKIRMQRNESDLALRCFIHYLKYVDMNDPYNKNTISFASDYIEFHSRPSETLLVAAEKCWKEKEEAKMENPVKNNASEGPSESIEPAIQHTDKDEKELYELFLTCWDQGVASPSYKKSTWKEMRGFLWRFGWRI
jgi:tetratricopeptide (TPR) repeat protein